MNDDLGDAPPEVGVPAGTEDPLAVLLRVQDLDTAISQLQHRKSTLAERRELDAAEAALAALATRATELGATREALRARQAELEEQIGALAGRRQALEERMYAARGSASRDLQAMDGEIHHLAQRRAEIEEIELEVMLEQEPVDADLARLAVERSQLEAAAGSLRAAVAAAEAVVGTEIATLEASRGIEAARLPTDLGDRYEVLRGRLGGIGAARLVGKRCEGCHLELPLAEVDRIRHLPTGTVVTCDQCGRILVRAPGPA
jgi:predicted  nucleic acid-binding Zn-ribbon protein